MPGEPNYTTHRAHLAAKAFVAACHEELPRGPPSQRCARIGVGCTTAPSSQGASATAGQIAKTDAATAITKVAPRAASRIVLQKRLLISLDAL